MSDLQDVIATSTVRAFNSGIHHERKRILKMLNEEIVKQEEAASTLDETGILIGLKRAELHVKEMKWT
jgi:hypothetical protein